MESLALRTIVTILCMSTQTSLTDAYQHLNVYTNCEIVKCLYVMRNEIMEPAVESRFAAEEKKPPRESAMLGADAVRSLMI